MIALHVLDKDASRHAFATPCAETDSGSIVLNIWDPISMPYPSKNA